MSDNPDIKIMEQALEGEWVKDVSRSYEGPADAIDRFEKLIANWKDDSGAELAECNDLRIAFALGREVEREEWRHELTERAERLRCAWHKLAPPEGLLDVQRHRCATSHALRTDARFMNIQTTRTYEGKYCNAEILDSLTDFMLDRPIYFKTFASQYISLATAREIVRELSSAIDSLPSDNPSIGL